MPTDVLIGLDGDRAAARANLIVTFVPDSDQPGARLMIGERYRFEATRGGPGWLLTRIEVARLWSTPPLPAGARVAQSTRGASVLAS